MDIVLGVSMTPTTVRMVLVEGEEADGLTVDNDVFDITAVDGAPTSSASEQVSSAVLGTQESAAASGHHLIATGVTWGDDAEAAALRECLVARGLEHVTVVSELHAAGALAQDVGQALGYRTTALMLIEPDTATLSVVETADGSIEKVLSQSLHSEDTTAVLTEMVTSLERPGVATAGPFRRWFRRGYHLGEVASGKPGVAARQCTRGPRAGVGPWRCAGLGQRAPI